MFLMRNIQETEHTRKKGAIKMPLKLNAKHLSEFIDSSEYIGIQPQITAAHETLHNKSGLGSEFLGWLALPQEYDKTEFEKIKQCAQRIQKNSDVLIVIGIGGSYLGSRAALEFLHSSFYNQMKKSTPEIYFAGNNLSPAYLQEILDLCHNKEVSVNVVSKSGTTTEPALAFRIFKDYMESRYGKDGARDRIYCTTDKARGTLKELADQEGYETFVIPDDIGGRFSVLTAVGLLPIAVSGADIEALMEGAGAAQAALCDTDLEKNDCYKYVAIRNILYRKGKTTELLVSYEPNFTLFAEWFKQLFGESEGKNQKGIFPASAIFSTDLHSLGQFIQDGSRTLFETVVTVAQPKFDLFVGESPENFDGLNFLANQNMSEIGKRAFEGTVLAHTEGGTPNVILELSTLSAYELGYMIYFFEKACAISGYLLGVNPFDQPGVEGYKKNMFALLGKKGYEDLRKELEGKLN